MRKTIKTFNKLYDLHGWLGATVPCPWSAYRNEMVTTYAMDGPTLDAMARLGHFMTTSNSVTFSARRERESHV